MEEVAPRYSVGDMVWLANRFGGPSLVEIKSIVASATYNSATHRKLAFEYQVALMDHLYPLGIEIRQVWDEGDLFPSRRALLAWQVRQLQIETKRMQEELDSRVAELHEMEAVDRQMGKVEG